MWRILSFVLVLCVLCAPARADEPAAGTSANIARGEYLVAIMECGGCHTTGALRGTRLPGHFLAGSEVGFGAGDAVGITAVFPPNLTPDPETGLGNWTDAQILQALRYGQRPDGRVLSPVMPWPVYGSRLTEADAASIVAYLRSIPPVHYRVPANFSAGEPPTGPYMIIEGE